MADRPRHFALDTEGLRISAREVLWDTEVFNTPVVQIDDLHLRDPEAGKQAFVEFQSWLDRERIGIVSARLEHTRLRESMLLEDNGFRFIEMVLHPHVHSLRQSATSDHSVSVLPAAESDLAVLEHMAETAFSNERYHVDPRLDPSLGSKRYRRWIHGSLSHESQRLLKLAHAGEVIGFFLIEEQPPDAVYWHLTAIAPAYQGRGYGWRSWGAMIQYHQRQGYTQISTTIAARNHRVLNLYARLGFRFLPPHMTFHWIRNG